MHKAFENFVQNCNLSAERLLVVHEISCAKQSLRVSVVLFEDAHQSGNHRRVYVLADSLTSNSRKEGIDSSQ